MKSFWRNLLLALSCFLLGYGIHWYRSLDSGRFSPLVEAFRETVEAEKFHHVVPVLKSYEEYVGREIVLDAFYKRHFEGDWVISELGPAATDLSICNHGDYFFYLSDGTRVDTDAILDDAPAAWIRGVIHHGMYLVQGGMAGDGFLRPDTTYLQINAVVFHPDVKLREGMRELYGPAPATNMK